MFGVSAARVAAWEHAAADPIEPVWTREREGGTHCRLSRAGDVLVVAGGHFVMALAAATGAVLWESPIEAGRMFVTSIAISHSDELVGLSYQDMHGNLDIFSLASGALVTTIDCSEHTEETDFRGMDFMSGGRVVAVSEDFGKLQIFSIDEGALLEEWTDDGAQPNGVAVDDRDNCFVSCAELQMSKWHSGEQLAQMDSSPNAYGITQCAALDPDAKARRLLGAAFAHVAIFDADSCEPLARFSLPGEQYHIHSVRGNGAGTVGGVFQRHYLPEDAGATPFGLFYRTVPLDRQ